MNKSIVSGIQALLSLALILYLITVLDWERIKFVLPQLHLEFVGQAYLLILFSVLVSSVRWGTLLKQLDVSQRLIDSLRYYLISLFYGAMLPGIIGGDVVRIGLGIKQHGMAMKGVLTASVLFERACGFLALLAIFAVMAWFVPAILGNELSFTGATYISLSVISAGFVIFFWTLKKAPERWFVKANGWKGWLNSFGLLLKRFRGLSVITLAIVIVLSFLVYFLDILSSYFLSRAMHLDVPFHFFLIIIPITYVLTALPISLGGLGVREGVLTFFLVKVGVVASDAVLLAFLIYLNWLAVALVGGIIQLMGKRFSY